jgi:hypothetical protein
VGKFRKIKTIAVALVLAGCADENRPDHVYRGTPETGFVEVDRPPSTGEKVAQVLDSTLQAAGDFGRGYSNTYNQYQATHPYQAPVYAPPQHGTMTIWQDGVPTMVSY